MPTSAERVRQLEDDARDLRSILGTFEVQLLVIDDFRKNAEALQSRQATELALLKQRLDENAKRFDRSEVSIEALLKDVATLKGSNGDLQKRVEFWEGRIWGGGLAVIGALVSAVATLAYAILRK